MRPDRFPCRFTLGWQLAAALVLGVAVGIVAGPRSAALRPLADLLLALLTGLAVPAVVAFALAGVSGVSPRRMGALGARLLAAFVLLSLAATAVGAGCAVLILGWARAPRAPAAGPLAPLAPPDLLHGWWRPATLTMEHAIPAALVAALLVGFAVAAWRERDPEGPGAALHEAFRRLAGLVTRALGHGRRPRDAPGRGRRVRHAGLRRPAGRLAARPRGPPARPPLRREGEHAGERARPPRLPRRARPAKGSLFGD